LAPWWWRFYGSAELFTPPATPSLRLISQTLGYGAADRVESGNICGIPAKKVYCWMALRWRFFKHFLHKIMKKVAKKNILIDNNNEIEKA
jgi:hypothetical protein